MVSLTRVLRACALALVCGLLSAQAVPVVFTGSIDIEDNYGYFIQFIVHDPTPTPTDTEYRLSWDQSSLSDISGNFTSVVNVPPATNQWTFSFTQEVLSSNYSLDFNLLTFEVPGWVSFDLDPYDPSIDIELNGLRSTISNLIPTQSYLADIGGTEQSETPFFAGTFTINALASGGAPEIDPRKSCLPCFFGLGALAATRRRRQIA